VNEVPKSASTGLAKGRRLGCLPKRRDQRQRILLATAKVIATLGYEQRSLADIAEG